MKKPNLSRKSLENISYALSAVGLVIQLVSKIVDGKKDAIDMTDAVTKEVARQMSNTKRDS